jgi:hypothetical protein
MPERFSGNLTGAERKQRRWDTIEGDVTPNDEREVWVIRICACGFPLGAVLAAIALKRCPDCGAATIPVEDVTRRVTVYADA